MPMPYIQKHYLKYNIGRGYICGHVDALHAAAPAADRYTDTIVKGLIQNVGCAGIISTVSRLYCDLNRTVTANNKQGMDEYRTTIKEILDFLHIVDPDTQKLTKPYLHLSFHGMKDANHGPSAIEVGTLQGKSCSPEIRLWFRKTLIRNARRIFPEINIVFDQKFKGNKSIIFHRKGDLPGYPGYGQHFHTFQIEIAQSLRKTYTPLLIKLFTELMTDFQSRFVTFNQF